MSWGRGSARFVAIAAVVGALSALSPVARAATPGEVCTAFPHRQTYVGDEGFFRAPAWHYDRTVTIEYDADSCAAQISAWGNYVLSIAGTATIHEGATLRGDVLDRRPFSSVLRTSSPNDSLGWPVAWWSCFDGRFSYLWTIGDVYSFSVTGDDGRWVMTQTDPSSDESIATTANGCRRRPSN